MSKKQSPYTQTPRFGAAAQTGARPKSSGNASASSRASVRSSRDSQMPTAAMVFGEVEKQWNPDTHAPREFDQIGKDQQPVKAIPPEVARSMAILQAVAPMSIAREDFHGDVNHWRRAARQLVNQLYRAKFVLGDLIEDVDDLHAMDKPGELHADDVPVADILRVSDAPNEKERLESKLKTAEGIIRKLYTKSMTLTHENAALRQENEHLRALAAAHSSRPHSANGKPRTSSTRAREASSMPASDRHGEHGFGSTGVATGSVVPEKPAALQGAECGGADGLAHSRPDTARSASVPPEYLQPGSRGARNGESTGEGKLESVAPGSKMHAEMKDLEVALKASQKRENTLRQELHNLKRLEILLWEGEHMQPVSSHEVVSKLRARLESAKGILKNVTEALQDSKEKVVDLETKLASCNTHTKRRLKGYLAHRHQLVAALLTLIERVPASGLRGKRDSAAQVEKAREQALEMAHNQQQLISQIRESVAAISELSSSIVGERHEMESEAGSDGSGDDDDAPDPFSTSSLVRSAGEE